MSTETAKRAKVELVRLNNGAEELKASVAVVMAAIRKLWSDIEHGGPMVVYDLYQACLDRDYAWFGANRSVAEALSLVDPGGGIHDTVRNVVVSAVEGEGRDMHLVRPLA